MGAPLQVARQAQQPVAAVAAAGRQYLTFRVGGETFAMAIAAIKEIIQYRDATDVPLMPAFMRGVINLRGRVVPVIDLCVRFGRGGTQATRRSCIVIVEVLHEGEPHDIGVMVDAVNAVLEIADADIEPAPSFGARLRADFISGMAKVGEQLAIVLDIDRVLSVDELSSLAAIAADSHPSNE